MTSTYLPHFEVQNFLQLQYPAKKVFADINPEKIPSKEIQAQGLAF